LYYGFGDGTWPIGKPGLIFKLDLTYADGSTTSAISDETWKTQLANAWKPGQYKRWYLRSLQEGLMRVSTLMVFQYVTPEKYSFEVIREQFVKTIDQKWLIKSKDDRAAVLTFEFAEQSVGFPYFTIEANEGAIIELYPWKTSVSPLYGLIM